MDLRPGLIQELKASRALIQALVSQLRLDEEIYPNWKLKELVAHLAGWDHATIAALQAYQAEQPTPMLAARGINAYNATSVETHRTLTYEQIYTEWLQARELLLQLLEQTPADKLETVFMFPWGEEGTVVDLIHIISEHEIEHTHEIRQLKRLLETDDEHESAD